MPRVEIDPHLPDLPNVRKRVLGRVARWGLLPVVLAASTLLAVACGSDSNSSVKAAVAPTTEVPPAAATQEISSSPTAEATPAIQPRPTEPATSTATPKVETAPIPSVSEIPTQLDSLLASVKAMPQSFNPYSTPESFVQDKIDIEVPAEKAKEALAKGDIAEARKQLADIRPGVRALGDPMKERYITEDELNKYDPQRLVLKRTDRVDPRIMDKYFDVVRILLALYGK